MLVSLLVLIAGDLLASLLLAKLHQRQEDLAAAIDEAVASLQVRGGLHPSQ